MSPPEWIWGILLALHGSAWALEVSKYDRDTVICSQGLSDCILKNEFFKANNNVAFQKLKPGFKLCKDRKAYVLCLEIELELHIPLDSVREDEVQSGDDDEADRDETTAEQASVTACYQIPRGLSTCKKVEFTINHTALAQQNQTKVSIVITQSNGINYGNQIIILTTLTTAEDIFAPSLNEVCSFKRQKHIHVPECQVPRVNFVLNLTTNQVELQFSGRSKTSPALCLQYEKNGICQEPSQNTIPFYSVAPCLCIQAWYKTDQVSRRIEKCPFNGCFPKISNQTLRHHLQQNMWNNVTVDMRLSKMTNGDMMLLWNISAPCRLEGEVHLCHKNCKERKDSRLLSNDTWKQNIKGLWVNEVAFESIDEQISHCVMVRIQGLDHEFGKICTNDAFVALAAAGRWHWSLLVVGVLLLVCLTALMICVLHDYVKKWAWSWPHGGFVKIGRKGHLVLLSPPDVDDGVAESVHQLGSLLCSQGFSVSVDQFSRKEQCSQGPLLWFHSQMLKLDRMGGRVVLVVTPKASQRAEEWSRLNRDGAAKMTQQFLSPYSDLFTASLCLIHKHKSLGKAAERFLLVKFDSSNQKSLPELLRGLPLFQLPSQTQSLLTELTVVETNMGPGGWMWRGCR
ncbi:interleukin-17 receptor C isoform X1 [Nothobranchius furzeri]|uniref:Transcript variant X1 n=2 Tax=Nothobranchius furzeri TaxID=105023 RepID=A0A9D2XUA9_NOTFU|nr:transcript variant X1 [Nothobranchius furzeri]KAF7207816.1 transcript variant X2 [Nothobranchius furzeri]